jgi:VWFA-related protein
MGLVFRRLLYIPIIIYASVLTAGAQDLTRELKVAPGGTLEIVNRSGRVAVKAEPAVGEEPVEARLTAMSPKGVSEADIKTGPAGGHTVITVAPSDKQKRVDIIVTVPERTVIKIETLTGAIEVVGNFASVEAKTETGTIVTDVPTDDLTYNFLWTASHPRYLADFDIARVKEKSAGRFEIKGRRRDAEEVKSKKAKVNNQVPGPESQVPSPTPDDQGVVPKDQRSKIKDQNPKIKDQTSISLNFTTDRGIVLLNVPPSEVMSDLRERPLTEAAKAIVRSGDSLLMEAIRRASPKYFGDYTRSLPPFQKQPTFAAKSAEIENNAARVKTALVRVTDLSNRSIPGLKADDFEVMENGQPREIISVERSNAPFNLVLLLDVSGSVENYVNFIRKAARNFVDTVDERDRVSIVIFNEDVKKLSGFTTDKAALSESLDTFDAGGGTAYYDALAYTVADTLRPLKGERTAIVILTDGDDNRSFLAFDSLMGSIQESGALVYPLYVPSGLIALAAQNADIDPMRAKYMSLTAKSEGEGERLAKVSGGVYYPITQIGQIQRAYEDIVVQMRSAYNITFRSDTANAVSNGTSPRLKVRSKRENTFATINSIVAKTSN